MYNALCEFQVVKLFRCIPPGRCQTEGVCSRVRPPEPGHQCRFSCGARLLEVPLPALSKSKRRSKGSKSRSPPRLPRTRSRLTPRQSALANTRRCGDRSMAGRCAPAPHQTSSGGSEGRLRSGSDSHIFRISVSPFAPHIDVRRFVPLKTASCSPTSLLLYAARQENRRESTSQSPPPAPAATLLCSSPPRSPRPPRRRARCGW